jgi:hypothetical protein
MRRYAASFAMLGFLLFATMARASEGKVCKVLPEFVDKKGRLSLAPSLYERDAYQAYLRKHPLLRTGLCVKIEYKAKGLNWEKTKLRAELRGLLTNSVETVTLEQPVKKSGFFDAWAEFNISGDKYRKFGELISWRVTLWEGDRQLSEQQSFLWSGVPLHSP